MDLLRIGEKLISRERVHRLVDRALERRAQGLSQQEVGDELGVDRTFLSRLEALGEVRRGGRVALIGFPVANRAELERVAQQAGVEWILLMSNDERWQFLEGLSAAELFNRIMDLVSEVREYDTVVFLGSDMRIGLMEAIVGSGRLVGVELGKSPLRADCHVDAARLAQILAGLMEGEARR